MPIRLNCPTCGKQLKMPDEWAGKKGKCPGCGGTFIIAAGGGGGAPAMAAPTMVAAPGAAGTGRRTRKEPRVAAKSKTPGGTTVAISWVPILLGLGALIVVGSIVAFIAGPKRVHAQWEEIAGQAHEDVENVVHKAMTYHQTGGSLALFAKMRSGPNVSEIQFWWEMLVMSMPEKVRVTGLTSEGEFEGWYYPKTREVDVNLETGAMVLPSGVKVSKGSGKIRITGRDKAGKVTAEVNGKNAELVDDSAAARARARALPGAAPANLPGVGAGGAAAQDAGDDE